MTKTLKTRPLAGSRRDCKGQGGGLLPPWIYDGLKTRSSEVQMKYKFWVYEPTLAGCTCG